MSFQWRDVLCGTLSTSWRRVKLVQFQFIRIQYNKLYIFTIWVIGYVYEYPTMHYFWIPRHNQSIIAYKTDWVFLEIPVENCIVGMLLTCPIGQIHDDCSITNYQTIRKPCIKNILTIYQVLCDNLSSNVWQTPYRKTVIGILKSQWWKSGYRYTTCRKFDMEIIKLQNYIEPLAKGVQPQMHLWRETIVIRPI